MNIMLQIVSQVANQITVDSYVPLLKCAATSPVSDSIPQTTCVVFCLMKNIIAQSEDCRAVK